jgi:hypothetical protein
MDRRLLNCFVIRLACAAAPMLLAVAPIAAQRASSDIIGRWRSLEQASSGLGAMLEFRNNGVVAYSPGAVVEAPYRTEGGELVLPPGTRDGPEQRQPLEWVGENKFRLIQTQVPAGVSPPYEEFTRVGARRNASAPLIGEWTATREMGGRKMEVRYIFSAGKLLLLMPFMTDEGQWTRSAGGDSVSFKITGRTSMEGQCKVDGDVLTLTQAGRTAQFNRY